MAVDEFAGNCAEMQVHTPGPWLVDDGDGEFNIHAPAVGASYVAQCGFLVQNRRVHYSGTEYTGRSNAKANADLIAAAPDLLSELRGLVEWLEENQRSIEAEVLMDDLLDGPRAALRKAGVTDNG